MSQFKKIILAVFIALLAVAALTAAMVLYKKYKFQSQPENAVAEVGDKSLVKKQEVDFSKYPEKFPVDIPMEAGAKITQNYNATTEDGRFQATRVLESNKPLSTSYTIYKAYLKDNDWELLRTTDQANYKMLFASKGIAHLQISLDSNVAGIKTISISYLESKY